MYWQGRTRAGVPTSSCSKPVVCQVLLVRRNQVCGLLVFERVEGSVVVLPQLRVTHNRGQVWIFPKLAVKGGRYMTFPSLGPSPVPHQCSWHETTVVFAVWRRTFIRIKSCHAGMFVCFGWGASLSIEAQNREVRRPLTCPSFVCLRACCPS